MQSDPQLRRWFLDFNRRYWKGELPMDTVLYWEPDGGHLGTTHKVDDSFLIRLCPSLRFSDRMAKVWLLHEMTHVAVWPADHGKRFKAERVRLFQAGAYDRLL